MNKEQVLKRALKIVAKRGRSYGTPRQNLAVIASLWSLYKGTKFSPQDVAVFMILTKLSRAQKSPKKLDHWIDACAYAAIAGELA